MKQKIFLLSAGFLLIVSGSLMAIEEPKYKVVEESGDIEIRIYESYLVAETIVSGEFEDASSSAFSSLFGYISGENIAQESIEMTAPVNQEKLESEGQEIEMTAPVSQESLDSGKYRISFVMPDHFTMATLPKPKDEKVKLREVPARKMVVIKYSGTWSEENYQEHKSQLFEFISEKGYQIKGQPVWARYNAPFIPWFMRRNEIMIEIK
jgi:effector-binding domain-containing protein